MRAVQIYLSRNSERTRVIFGVDYLGTQDIEDDPAYTWEQRLTRCSELACYALLLGEAPEGTLLVHGTIHGEDSPLGRIGHAWLRLPDGTIWEPIAAELHVNWAAWRDWAAAKVEATYTTEEAARNVLVHSHYGRWHESQYK